MRCGYVRLRCGTTQATPHAVLFDTPRHDDGEGDAYRCARIVAFVGLDAVRGVTRYLCVASRREAVADDGLGLWVVVASGIGEREDLQAVGWVAWGE